VFPIFDPQSSILDPRSSILDPQSSILDLPHFFVVDFHFSTAALIAPRRDVELANGL